MSTLLLAAVVLTEAALLAGLTVSYRRGNAVAAVNAVLSIAATMVPTGLAWFLPGVGETFAVFASPLTLWVALAGVVHVLGMLGRYESVWWWDHLTHTVSAGFVAALVYAGLVVTLHSGPGGEPSWLVALGTLGGTLLVGVVWEGAEVVSRAVAERYDIKPVLVHYGWRDTAYDLVFDVVGAFLVVLLDLRLFVPTVEAVLAAV